MFAHAYYVVYKSARGVLCIYCFDNHVEVFGRSTGTSTKKPRQSDEDTVCDDV